jgi:pimeloyl-ACP methyl ester carboxylesterase
MSALEIPNVATFDVHLWADGDGSPVVFLHGYERHPGAAPFLARLAEGRRVLAPEHPGFGSSTGFDAFHDVVDVALYYRELIESCQLGPVDLIGHSLGGMFAAEVAAICPHLVRRLVLVNPFGVWVDDVPSVDPFGQPELVADAKWHGDPPAAEPSNLEVDPDDPHGHTITQVRNLATAAKFMWPIADRGLRRRLPYIDAPTLVLHGGSDGLVPLAQAEEFVRLIPDAQLAVIADAGHYPMVEEEDEFLAAVERHLAA